MTRETLSVLVPVWNERPTIERLLNAVVGVDAGVTLEVLVADDGSTDGTREILARLDLPGLRVIFMDDNVGRGGVLKHLWTLATGPEGVRLVVGDVRDRAAATEALDGVDARHESHGHGQSHPGHRSRANPLVHPGVVDGRLRRLPGRSSR